MDWRNVKKFVVGEPYDAEVEYLESNGTQIISVPNPYPDAMPIDLQVTGGANQLIFSCGGTRGYGKFTTDANGNYAVEGTSSGVDSFGIPGTTRVTALVTNPKSNGYFTEVEINGVSKRATRGRGVTSNNMSFLGNANFGYGSMRIYGIGHYKLVRVGQVGCLYDPETGNFIYPTTGTLACGPDVRVIQRQEVVKITSSDYPLVLGAKRVEYIQGNCVHNWIDTGVQVSGLIDMELKMGFNADSNNYGASPTQYPDDPELYRGYTWLVQPYGTGTRLRLRTSGPGTYRNYVDSSNVWSVDVPHTLKISQTDKTLQVDGATVLTNVGQNATAVSNYIALCNSRNSNGSTSASNTESVCRLYYCKMWRDGTLVRDFVPIKVGTEGCLYDKVTDTVYHNPGTVPFVCGAEVAETVLWRKPVPYDSEVEYLESTGTQYIDTGIAFEPAKSTVVTANAAAPTDNRYVVVGSFTSPSYAAMNIEFGGTSNSHARQPRGYVKTVSSGAVDIWSGVTLASGVPADIELSYSATNGAVAVKINGTTAATGTAPTTGTVSGNDNFKLFLDSRPDPSPIANAGRIYGVTIVKDGVLVRDFRPVRVGTTGYLFDRISWTLFGNAGTGNFGYGADVPSA